MPAPFAREVEIPEGAIAEAVDGMVVPVREDGKIQDGRTKELGRGGRQELVREVWPGP